MRTGIATFGLDTGRCPPWLFERMKRLARLVTEAIVLEQGSKEFVRRMSDPYFFQSFGTVLAFDWDASGLTTTTTGALKEALRGTERTLEIFVAGGKGKTSLKTPDDIAQYADWHGFNPKPLIYASKMAAKVDNTALQDGFTLYHHSFIFTKPSGGSSPLWSIVQQGMNTEKGRARRYHWLSDKVRDFVEEPHAGIKDSGKQPTRSQAHDLRGVILNLVAKQSRKTRDTSAKLIKDEFPTLLKDGMRVLDYVNFPFQRQRLEKSLRVANEVGPRNFEELLGVRGIGPKAIRALSLISEIIYGAKPSYEDPARYSYAHGGKDGIPYPVDKPVYDTTISLLNRALQKARLGYYERLHALRRLHQTET